MHKPIKHVEKAIALGANAAWFVFDKLNSINRNPGFAPKWSDKPLLKSWEKQKPTLGWPRETDSLCPRCVPEVRQQILDGKLPVEILKNEKIGEIKAQIIERDGKIMMVKECPMHGKFEDIMSIDPAFSQHLEDVFPGRDMRAHNDEKLHDHGTSTITHGRGCVLTVDLTNRCNMMCDPCFMDANQVGFVHELSWEDIKTLLDNAISIKPRRQLSVQFSGGEPTLSPYFLDAIRYCRKLGYQSVQAATNGIEFAKRPEFAKEAADAGLRYAYLQFDGIGNAANSHRAVGNLFDVKLRAIENLYAAGVDIVPVITIVNGINNEQVGAVVRFALDNPKKIPFLSFQPVSFTGRDEAVTDERQQSPALHPFAPGSRREESNRSGRAHSRLVPDLLHEHLLRLRRSGPRAGRAVGPALLRLPSQLRHRHGHHVRQGDQGIPAGDGVPERRPVGQGRRPHQRRRTSKKLSVLGVSLALLRNYNPYEAPTHFRLSDLIAEVRQMLRHDQEEVRQGHRRPHHGRHRAAPRRPLELPVHRRHVVPGSVQLRFPPHRAVHHSLRHAGRRDLLLRVQHRRRLAQHHREDAHDRDAHQVV